MDPSLRPRRGLTGTVTTNTSPKYEKYAAKVGQDGHYFSRPSTGAAAGTTHNGSATANGKHGRKSSLSIKRSGGRLTVWDKMGGGLNTISPGETKVLVGLTLLGAVVRFWRIDRPTSVVFDEVHFGGFANKYIQSRFFMDVHPPLAKLLITLMAFVFGFKGGSFDFKDIGKEYSEANVPYVAMRMLPATLGLALITLSYLTMRAMQLKPTTALLGALMIMFENGLITQSRFILLDSPLLFFTALSMFFWIGFANENEMARDRGGRVGPFSRRWWIWLSLTGLSLGAVLSCKWVGLFTIATVGVLTVVQLWSMLGDLRVPIPLLARHFVARAICLIGLPMVFYMAMFAIHFAILSNSGEGDGFMSSEFQHTLRGHGMDDTFADVMVGSHVTLRHLHTQGGYLHSHPHVYPGGSKQQQITLYPHRDDNNVWLLLNATKNEDIADPETHSPPTPVKDRHIIVLHHISTNKKLHSHDIRAPITEVDYQNEVSAYGFDGFEGDANDHFQIEFDTAETDGKEALKSLQTLRTRFRLRHLLTGCYLFSHKVKLPDWGFEQQEVTCNKNPSKENALWYIETNTHAALPADAKKVNYRRPGFFKKFAELQAVMWTTNAGLTDRHAYDSRPSSWPLLRRGINFWVKDHRQVYLIGNPVVWWTSALSVFAYAAVRGLLILRAQRGCKDFVNSTVVFYDQLGAFLALGWFLHFFPFFLMSRQLFLHHYFPALYFSILLAAGTFDLATSALKPRIRLQLVVFATLTVVAAWWYFSPLAYAGVWTRSQCQRAQWRSNWDFSCSDFLESKSNYKTIVPAALRDPTEGESAQTSNVANAVEPGKDIFVEGAPQKAPQSSAVPADPAAASAGLGDQSDDPAEAGEDAATTGPQQDGRQPQQGGDGVAIPAQPGATTEPGVAPPPEARQLAQNARDVPAEPVEGARDQARNADEREQRDLEAENELDRELEKERAGEAGLLDDI